MSNRHTIFAEAPRVFRDPDFLSTQARRAVAGQAMPPALSVVVPVHDEAGNVLPLLSEIGTALEGLIQYEVIYVDDCSCDSTPDELASALARFPRLRALRHVVNCGQSTAIRTGVRAARAPLVAVLDGDGQNDPADIPGLLACWKREHTAATPLLIAGLRERRRDSWVRRASSRLANGVRAALLGDRTTDTGCGLKLFARQQFLELPFFDHMHRFLPALFLRQGGRVLSVPVTHRPRRHGRSHYGIRNRLWIGLIDLLGVMWLDRRMRRPVIQPIIAARQSPHHAE